MQKLAAIVDSLRNQGFRITPQRVAIVEYMMNTDSHPSAEDLYKAIKKKYPMVSLATVYKTLELLGRIGIVKELSFPDGARYDANADTHINLVCLNCGKIEDMIDEKSLQVLESNVVKKSKYRILSRRFELYGYCNECQSKMIAT
jgi:Fur family peroxide stress response transcriptional regulator